MNCCKDCKHFKDGSGRVYIEPRCTALGDEDARVIRQYVCGITEARLWESRIVENSTHAEATAYRD